MQKYNLNPLWQVFFEFILQLFLNSLIPRFVNTKVFFELGIISGELGTNTIVLSIGIVICYCFETALGIAAKSPQRSEDLQRIARPSLRGHEANRERTGN